MYFYFKSNFAWGSDLWQLKNTYNTKGSYTGLTNVEETKTASYHNARFDTICLGMNHNEVTKWLLLEYSADSLYSVIADGEYKPTSLGRDAWKSLISDSSLQPHCNREGFNVNLGSKARIGISSNNEEHCGSTDSRLGFGTKGGSCGQNDANSVGNEARCAPDNGEKSIMAFGYILVQMKNIPGKLSLSTLSYYCM